MAEETKPDTPPEGEKFVDLDAAAMAKPENPPPPAPPPEPVQFADTDHAAMAKPAADPPALKPEPYADTPSAIRDRYWRVCWQGYFGTFKADDAPGAVRLFNDRVAEITEDRNPSSEVLDAACRQLAETPGVVEELQEGKRWWHVTLPGIGDLTNIKAASEEAAIAEFNRICGVTRNGTFAECEEKQTDSAYVVEEQASIDEAREQPAPV